MPQKEQHLRGGMAGGSLKGAKKREPLRENKKSIRVHTVSQDIVFGSQGMGQCRPHHQHLDNQVHHQRQVHQHHQHRLHPWPLWPVAPQVHQAHQGVLMVLYKGGGTATADTTGDADALADAVTHTDAKEGEDVLADTLADTLAPQYALTNIVMSTYRISPNVIQRHPRKASTS